MMESKLKTINSVKSEKNHLNKFLSAPAQSSFSSAGISAENTA